MDDLSKTKAQLISEAADLRRRLDQLEGKGGEGEAAADTLRRLASFPEQNPDPVIEIERNGAVSYLNPIARERFPDLEREGISHPALDGPGVDFHRLESWRERRVRARCSR